MEAVGEILKENKERMTRKENERKAPVMMGVCEGTEGRSTHDIGKEIQREKRVSRS